MFEKDLASEDDMLRELRAGRFRAGRRVTPGNYEVVGETEVVA
jgi:hypothetical protein